MTTIRISVMASVMLACLGAAPAQAQLARTFVSSVNGNDVNDCNRLTPCRTFQRAHDNTFDQGEITVLDAGGYGAVTITKSVSIINDGVGDAGMLVSGNAIGVTINAPNAYVALRGITIQGIGQSSGIQVTNAAVVTISKCVIRNLTFTGIQWSPNATSQNRLAISDTLIADNGQFGIFLAPSGAAARYVSLSRVEMYDNSIHGLLAYGANSGGFIYVSVSESVANKNGQAGFAAISDTLHAAVKVLVVRSSSSENGTYGFLNGTDPGNGVTSNNVTGIGDSLVVNNALGAISGNGLFTFGDNASYQNGGGPAGQDLGTAHAKF